MVIWWACLKDASTSVLSGSVDVGMGLTSGRRVCALLAFGRVPPHTLPEGAVGLLHAVGVPTGLCSAELT